MISKFFNPLINFTIIILTISLIYLLIMSDSKKPLKIISYSESFKIKHGTIDYLLYSYKKGDDLSKLFKDYSTTKSFFDFNNPTFNPNNDSLLRIFSNNYIKYTIKEYDTVLTIAQNYHIPVKEISQSNNIESYELKAGEVLFLPLKSLETLTKNENYTLITYKVRQGENISDISKRFNVTKEDILKQNFLSSDSLHVGQILILKVYSNKT